jgi:DNA replication protein DnaC
VNERILRNKSTIISTNLNMNQIADTYSERTLSRILSSYTTIRLTGDDIRIRKRQSH